MRKLQPENVGNSNYELIIKIINTKQLVIAAFTVAYLSLK